MTQAGNYRSTLDMGVAAADADGWTCPGFVRASSLSDSGFPADGWDRPQRRRF
jgi:hypothetical protein